MTKAGAPGRQSSRSPRQSTPAAGAEATGIVAGTLAEELELLVLPADLRPIATEARVRIVHGSSATPAVDI